MTPTYTHYVCNSSTTLNLRNLMNKTLEASPSTSQLPWEEWPVELQPAIWDVYPFLYTCALWIFQISRRKPPLDLWNLLITWMIYMVQGFFKSTLCTYSIHACISLCIISHIYIYIIYTCVTTTSSISPDSYRSSTISFYIQTQRGPSNHQPSFYIDCPLSCWLAVILGIHPASEP